MINRLALDHLTAIEAHPARLVEIAGATGFGAVCLFQRAMAELPLMPSYDLVADPAARREVRARADQLGIAIELAYPFSFGSRTEVMTLRPDLECAAELGAGVVNALVYDRDEQRRADRLAEFCDLAAPLGLKTAVEFFPGSAVRDLAQASALVGRVDRPGSIGINVDLLHLVRSGGSPRDLHAIEPEEIFYAQVCDGPIWLTPAEAQSEASSNRLLPGAGEFDIAGFLDVLPEACPVSLEIPRSDPADLEERARQAITAYEGVR